jgi:hypothetical protein
LPSPGRWRPRLQAPTGPASPSPRPRASTGSAAPSPGSHRSGGGPDWRRLRRRARAGGGSVSRHLPAPRRRRSVPGPLPARRRRCRAPTGLAGARTGGRSVFAGGLLPASTLLLSDLSVRHRRPWAKSTPSCMFVQHRRLWTKSRFEFRTPPAENWALCFYSKSRAHGSIPAAADGRIDRLNNPSVEKFSSPELVVQR